MLRPTLEVRSRDLAFTTYSILYDYERINHVEMALPCLALVHEHMYDVVLVPCSLVMLFNGVV